MERAPTSPTGVTMMTDLTKASALKLKAKRLVIDGDVEGAIDCLLEAAALHREAAKEDDRHYVEAAGLLREAANLYLTPVKSRCINEANKPDLGELPILWLRCPTCGGTAFTGVQGTKDQTCDNCGYVSESLK